MNKVEYYDYTKTDSNYRSIYHLINQYPDSIGIELGIYRALSFCGILDCCPRIKTLYGVDNWQPHIDNKYDINGFTVDIKDIEISKQIAFHNIKYNKNHAKARLYENNSANVVDKFSDNYFDFILIDTYMNEQDVKDELERWWPKVKTNGIFAGHDWDTNAVKNAVIPFFNNKNIFVSDYDNLWVSIKK